MTRSHATASATLVVLLSGMCFGTIPIFTVLATRDGAELGTILGWRYLLACAVFLGAGALQREPLTLPRSHRWEVVLLAGGGQAMIGGVELSALRFIPAATMVFLFYSYPAWVAIFAAVRRTERVTAMRAGALALSIAGIVLMVGAPGASSLDSRGVALALGGAIGYALYIPLMERLQRGLSPYALSAYAVLVAGVVFVVLGLAAPRFVGAFTARVSPRAWGAIAGLAIISTGLAFILFLNGLSKLGPVRTAIISTVEPLTAAVLQALVLKQPLGRSTIAGGAMIAAAVMLLQLRGAEPAASAGAPPSP